VTAESVEPTTERLDPASQPKVSAPTPAAVSDAAAKRPQLFLRVLLSVFALVMLWQWLSLVRQQPTAVTIERGAAFRDTFRVDVNHAGWVEWLQLEGIGQSLAHRIVADRELNGPFSSINDLSRVPGIGPKTLDRIRPWLKISHDSKRTESR
jgi:competence protein ComEA